VSRKESFSRYSCLLLGGIQPVINDLAKKEDQIEAKRESRMQEGTGFASFSGSYIADMITLSSSINAFRVS
jgi:hypothetical protein